MQAPKCKLCGRAEWNGIIYVTKQDSVDTSANDRPTLEVTPEMIEAGRMALREFHIGEEVGAILSAVYIAMALEASDYGQRNAASWIRPSR